MAKEETDISHDILVDQSKIGNRFFKNVRGGAYPIATVKPLLAAILRCDWASVIAQARNLRPLQFGLQAAGSSDLIGGTVVRITPEMVGRDILVFTAIEVKTLTGTVQPDQSDFIKFIRKFGGFAGVARSKEDARRICAFCA